MQGEDIIAKRKNKERMELLSVWKDRLTLIEPHIRDWEDFIAIRSLFCTNEELIESRLKLAKISLKKDRHPLYK